MASVLDMSILSYFAPVFVFALVWIITYAILEKTKLFGDNQAIHWVIALCMAVMVVIIPGLTDVIQLITPWFIVFFIFVTLLVVIFLFMGVKGDTIAGVFGGNQFVIWVIVLVSLGILGYALMMVYGDAIHNITSPEDENNLNAQIGQIIFHPKIMGMGLVLVIAGLIVRFVSASR
jgi:hypothetical protein